MMVALFISCWWNCQNSIAVLQMTRAGFLAELSAVWKLKLHRCLKWLAAALFLFILSNLYMDSHTHYSIKMKLPRCIQINLRKSRETKTNTLQLFRIVWWEKMIKQMRESYWNVAKYKLIFWGGAVFCTPVLLCLLEFECMVTFIIFHATSPPWVNPLCKCSLVMTSSCYCATWNFAITHTDQGKSGGFWWQNEAQELPHKFY